MSYLLHYFCAFAMRSEKENLVEASWVQFLNPLGIASLRRAVIHFCRRLIRNLKCVYQEGKGKSEECRLIN